MNNIQFKLLLLAIGLPFFLNAQESNEQLARKAADPTALIWQLQIEDYWKIKSNDGQKNANNLRLRAVIPFNKTKYYPEHLLRITTNWQIQYSGQQNLSNTEIFDLLIPKRYNWGAYSLGPIIQLPTHAPYDETQSILAFGIAVGISINTPKIEKWQLDILIRYLDSFTNDANRISSLKIQPSLTYHINNGYYLETEPEISLDLYKQDNYIPINIRFGRAFSLRSLKINAYIEPEYSLVDSNNKNTQWGLRFGWRFILDK
ncbi:hypothetical protein K5X82_09980 [Halosquirtibacter xylanolyticus]|uniref:hypothetical protein n=1 Tax=Halosquirtibacter xylanolyticus TaxID=3374599 RepID=UPI003749F603|nr:hypothetical protein K5X82_09980 [Prolixibacteraceae bacterium]